MRIHLLDLYTDSQLTKYNLLIRLYHKMGNGQGSIIDEEEAGRFMKAGVELITTLPSLTQQEGNPSFQPTEEQILEDTLQMPNQQELIIEEQQIKARQEQIISRLKELYPLLPQGKRDVISEAKTLLATYTANDREIEALKMKTETLANRMREGERLQRLMRITLAKDMQEVTQEAMNTIHTHVGPILNQISSINVPIPAPEIEPTPDTSQSKTDP